jgi:hypothetical protein
MWIRKEPFPDLDVFGSDTIDWVADPDTSEYRLTRPVVDWPAA